VRSTIRGNPSSTPRTRCSVRAHVRVEWRTGSSKRKSGAVLTTLAIALPTTGAILAAYGAPDRPLLAWLHGVTGSLFLLMFVAHGLSAIRARRRAARSRR
jgi:hypothetical protein